MRAWTKAGMACRWTTSVGATRAGTALGWVGLGAVATGAATYGALALRSLAVRRGKRSRLSADDSEVGRLRVRQSVVEGQRYEPGPFGDLEGHNYVSLTTFRKSGEPVPTPLWFALLDGVVYFTTDPRSGKMKRIGHDPRVTLTPCNAWGRPRGESIEGVARIIDGAAPERAERALREKYRLGLALFHLFGRREVGEVTLEVRPTDTEGARPS